MFPILDENKSLKKPYVTYGLISINVLIFLFFFLGGTKTLNDGIISLGIFPIDIIMGERLWTFITNMFMHADLMHLFGNMLYLWVFGDNIENAFGHTKYLLFYLFSGVVASLTHILSLLVSLPSFNLVGFSIPSVGASGAISAVLGAYLYLYPRKRIRTLFFLVFIQIVNIPAYFYLGFWFLYQLIMGFFSLTGLSPGIAFWAHIGGFICGLLFAHLFRLKYSNNKVRTRQTLSHSFKILSPIVEIIDQDDQILIVVSLPGVYEKDIHLEIYSSRLLIAANRKDVQFFKEIHLPTKIIPKLTDFKFRNGVLTFLLNKTGF